MGLGGALQKLLTSNPGVVQQLQGGGDPGMAARSPQVMGMLGGGAGGPTRQWTPPPMADVPFMPHAQVGPQSIALGQPTPPPGPAVPPSRPPMGGWGSAQTGGPMSTFQQMPNSPWSVGWSPPSSGSNGAVPWAVASRPPAPALNGPAGAARPMNGFGKGGAPGSVPMHNGPTNLGFGKGGASGSVPAAAQLPTRWAY